MCLFLLASVEANRIQSGSWKGAGKHSNPKTSHSVCKADTLLGLSCLTNCLACWCTPPPAQTEGCCGRTWRPFKETQTSGALAPQTPCSHRSLSCPARQQHLFVLCAVLTAQENEHTLNDHTARLERGQGAIENATQSLLCVNGTKEPVRVEEWEWDNQDSGTTDLTQVVSSLVTGLRWSLNLYVNTPRMSRSAASRKQEATSWECSAGIRGTQHLLNVQHKCHTLKSGRLLLVDCQDSTCFPLEHFFTLMNCC